MNVSKGPNGLEKVKLTHNDGTEFYVFLSQYEIDRASEDEDFLEELITKYYLLYKKNLVGSVNEGAEEISAARPLNEIENISKNETFSTTLKMWTDSNIRLLIDLYKQHEKEFEIGLKKNVWKKVADLISQQNGINVTASQCDTKFKGLKEYYKTVKKHNETSGNNFKYWVYFDLMEELLGKKPEIVAAYTCSSSRGLLNSNNLPINASANDSTHLDTSADERLASGSSSFENVQTRKRRREENTAERRHKEKIERQDRFLDLFERLVTSLEKKE